MGDIKRQKTDEEFDILSHLPGTIQAVVMDYAPDHCERYMDVMADIREFGRCRYIWRLQVLYNYEFRINSTRGRFKCVGENFWDHVQRREYESWSYDDDHDAEDEIGSFYFS
jgi:hypothetical protein